MTRGWNGSSFLGVGGFVGGANVGESVDVVVTGIFVVGARVGARVGSIVVGVMEGLSVGSVVVAV